MKKILIIIVLLMVIFSVDMDTKEEEDSVQEYSEIKD
ncbi:hypothetical protein SDC9_212685 [bioreactor metagenome]|uniref:Uncharacterized protein n=1 Tax=bioreactor metagenome TaxID=1076179 RepID=A0A645JNI4_9ZZZZ